MLHFEMYDGRMRSVRASAIIGIIDHPTEGKVWIETLPGGDENTNEVKGSRAEVLRMMEAQP
jgi:hypothetical protein